MKNNIEIYALIQNAIKEKATPGVSYCLNNIKSPENETVYLGFKNYAHQSKINSGCIYDLASLTKVIATTTRILQLLSENKIILTTTVSSILPDTPYSKITIKNLLLHNSGLPADLENVSSYRDKEDVLYAIKHQNLVYKTGTNMIYSDINFILLGLIIEKIDRMSLDKSIAEHLLKPLNLTHTGYCLDKTYDVSNFVPTEQTPTRGTLCGKVHDETAGKLSGVSGNAGLFSTLDDLKKFCAMYLNKGTYNGKNIIPAEYIESLFNYNFLGRTLGWKRWDKNSHTLWHTGFTGTSIALDFDNNSYYICLTNRVNPTRANKKWLNIRRLAIGLFFEKPELLPTIDESK